MRSTTTPNETTNREPNRTVKYPTKVLKLIAAGLRLGLNGRQWTASLLIGLLLLPVFSLPVGASITVGGAADSAESTALEAVNPPRRAWETAWNELSARYEEWETARRPGNAPIITAAPIAASEFASDEPAGAVTDEKAAAEKNPAKKPSGESEPAETAKEADEKAMTAASPEDAKLFDSQMTNPTVNDTTATLKTPPTAPVAAPALLNQLPGDERDSVYSYGNNLGSPVGQTEAEGASRPSAIPIKHRVGAANFSFDVPLASLAGRGLDAGVGMTYNSRTWNKSCLAYGPTFECTENHFTYDVEQSWVAPGFSTGYGSLETVPVIRYTHKPGTSTFYNYTEIVPLGVTDADGTRHQMECREFVPVYNSDSYRCTGYKSVDGSFILMESQGWVANVNNSPSYPNTINYGTTEFVAAFSNGSKVYYSGGFGGGNNRKHYPTIVQDNNGNRLRIAYKEHETGRIDYITDTLNRKIKFYYENDANGNPDKLVTITVPNMQNQEMETVRFYYQNNGAFNPQSGFNGTVTAPATLRTLQYVYFPTTKTGFQYEYHPFFGMIQKISRRVAMTVSDENSATSKTAAGLVTSYGDWTATTEYDYPSGSPALSDAPRYSKRTDDWRGRTSQNPMETLYHVPEPTPGVDEVISQITTKDDGFDTVTENKIVGGLIKEVSVEQDYGQLSDLMSKTVYFWNTEQCTGHCPQARNPKLMRTEVTNEADLVKTTEFEYDAYDNQKKVKEYDYREIGATDGTPLRTTEMTYETGANWISNNLLHLVREVKVTVGGAVASKTLYEYDGNPLVGRDMDTPETLGTFDRSYDPAHPSACHLVCPVEPFDRPCSGSSEFTEDPEDPSYAVDHCTRIYNPGYSVSSIYRGNVTKIGRMLDLNAAAISDTNSDKTDYTYDLAGNLVTATLSCCQLKTLSYSSETGYAFPVSETKGTSPQLTSSVAYNKYTGLVTSSTDENGQVTGYQYEPSTLRQTQVNYPNGGYTQTEYSDVLAVGSSAQQLIGFIKTTSLLEASKTTVGYTYFDGRGATLRSASQVPGNQWSVSAVEYNRTGRAVKSYNPFYGGAPTAAPPPGTAFTTVTGWDALGRTTEVTMQDGTKLRTAFSDRTDRPSGFEKMFMTVTDQAGKQRRQVMNSLGRIVRVDEPDVSASNLGLGAVDTPVQPTVYEYDGNDNLIKTTQMDGTVPQVREFRYDALSRLTHEKQVEATATLDYAGVQQTSGGQWTKVLKYTSKGLLIESTDARGVKTTFAYDGLNRVSGVGHSDGTPSVTYFYDQTRSGFYNKGALTRIETVNQPNTSPDTLATATEFDYDLIGMIKQQRQSIGTQTYNLAYSYNLAGQLVSETYPSGRVVTTGYDAAGRMQSVADQSRTYLGSVGYLGKGNSVNSLVLGNGTAQGFAYNDRLQLESQSLTKPNEVLQQYNYAYGQLNTTTNTLENNGKLAQVESYLTGGSKQWTQKHQYDALGRLKESAEYRGDAPNTLSYKQTFDYDNFGNLYRKTANNQITGQQSPLPFTAIEAADIERTTNRFKPATGTVYDDAGNVTTDNKFRAMSFGYDANGRMVKAIKANTPDAMSVYDGSGRRVAERVSNTWKFFIYDDGGNIVAEYGSTRSADEGGVKYPYTDWQGSTRALTSNAGFIQSRQDFTAFGEEIGVGVGQRTALQSFGVINALNQKYAETERDEGTGLDHTKFRKLENRAGRWTSPDPYNGSAKIGNPQSFNRYTYVENQPTNFTDPSGLFMQAPLGIVTVRAEYEPLDWDTLHYLMFGQYGSGILESGSPQDPIEAGGSGEGNEPSTCAGFANNLARTASLWSGAPGGLLTFGRVLGYHAKNSLSKSKDEKGNDLFAIDGVKGSLTSGGQRADVYKHLAGAAGATLIGSNRVDPIGIATALTGDETLAEQNADDLEASLGMNPFHSAEEGGTELRDNKAGARIGNIIKDVFLDKSLSPFEKQAKAEKLIFDEICDS